MSDTMERLFDRIGEIEDFFLEEAESLDLIRKKATDRKRIAKYSAYGAAGIAISAGVAMVCWKLRANRIAKSA